MKCLNCNHNLPDDSQFCQYCGSKVEKVLHSNVETPHVTLPTTETTPAEITPEALNALLRTQAKALNIKYCSRCGSMVDSQTQKCIGCGKKHHEGTRFNKLSIAVIILSLAIIASVVINIVQYNELDHLSWRENYLEGQVSDLEAYNLANSWALKFYEDYAALVNEKSKKYHQYGCDDFDESSFWIYNINAAEQQGYYACPECH